MIKNFASKKIIAKVIAIILIVIILIIYNIIPIHSFTDLIKENPFKKLFSYNSDLQKDIRDFFL